MTWIKNILEVNVASFRPRTIGLQNVDLVNDSGGNDQLLKFMARRGFGRIPSARSCRETEVSRSRKGRAARKQRSLLVLR